MLAFLLAPRSGPPVDVSGHLPIATTLLWIAFACLLLFWVARPELWRRLWLERVDPRPAGLFRIVFGLVVLWTLLDLIPMARFLFTDEGLWLPSLARRNYGGELRNLWDPEHGFEHWWSPIQAFLGVPDHPWEARPWTGKFSLFHIRADPAFVYAVYALTCGAVMAMILGVRTRLATLLSWLLVNSVYMYSPIWYSGADTVIRCFLFLGVLTRWGEAYSLDAWWRRKREILAGAPQLPALKKIPAWPLRLMMLQLTIIYCATGVLKAGFTWLDGTALFYALSLDHFYRHPAQIHVATFLQVIGFLPLATWITKVWETLFPLALIGAALKVFERERAAGLWPAAAAWRRWLSYGLLVAVVVILAYVAGLVAFYYYNPDEAPWPITKVQAQVIATTACLAAPALLTGGLLWLRARRPRWYAWTLRWLFGKRLWLGIGAAMHAVIDVLMNVGLFVQVMFAVYIPWLSGAELDAVWRTLMSRPLRPGEGSRPQRKEAWRRTLLGPIDRLRFRAPRDPYRIFHHPDEASIRRVALVRCWDLGARVAFEADASVGSGALQVQVPGEAARRAGAAAGGALTAVLPGFWWLYPCSRVPGLGRFAGGVVLRTFGLR